MAATIEYKQERYNATMGKFDGNLNKMAADRWTVVSMDLVGDNTFLVTYSRPLPVRVRKVYETTVSSGHHDFQDEFEHRITNGWSLRNYSTAVVPNNFDRFIPGGFIYTAIWEKRV